MTSPRAQETERLWQTGALTGDAKASVTVLFWFVPSIVAPTESTQGDEVGNRSESPLRYIWELETHSKAKSDNHVPAVGMIVTRRSLISRRRHQRDSASDNLGKLEKNRQVRTQRTRLCGKRTKSACFFSVFFFVSYLSVAALHILLGISAAADAAFTLSVFRPSPAFPNNYKSNNNNNNKNQICHLMLMT